MELLPQRYPIEYAEYGLAIPFTVPVRLRMAVFCSYMITVLDDRIQIKLTRSGAPQCLVLQSVRVRLWENISVRSNESRLIEAPNALEHPLVEDIPRSTVAWQFQLCGVHLPVVCSTSRNTRFLSIGSDSKSPGESPRRRSYEFWQR